MTLEQQRKRLGRDLPQDPAQSSFPLPLPPSNGPDSGPGAGAGPWAVGAWRGRRLRRRHEGEGSALKVTMSCGAGSLET